MNFLYLLFIGGALAFIQCMVGGTRLLFSIPAYSMIAVAAVLSVFSIRRPSQRIFHTGMAAAVALVTVVVLRAYYSPVPYFALTDGLMAVGCLMVYLLTALYITETRHRLWIIGVLFLIAAVHAWVGTVQFGKADGFMLFGFSRNDTSARASGMLISGNHFSGYLEAVAMFALGMTCWSRWQIAAKLMSAYIALICFYGVAISGSRGGFLSSAIGLLVFVALSIWVVAIAKPGRLGKTVLAAVILLVLFGGIMGGIAARSYAVNNRLGLLKVATSDVRIYNWLATLDQFRVSPWIGTGSATHLYYGRLFRRPQIQTDPVHAHGDYLELLAEYGIIGAAFGLLFLGAHITSGMRGIRNISQWRLRPFPGFPQSDTLAVDIGAMAAVATLMAHSVVDFNMHIPGNALLYAFIFGILTAPNGGRGDEPHVWLSTTTALRLLLVLLGIGTLACGLPKLKGEQLAESARGALRDGKHRQAIDQAKLAIEAEPDNPDPYFYLGEANRAIGNGIRIAPLRRSFLEHSVEAFRQGLERFPGDERALVRLAQSLDALQRYDEADAVYQEAISHDPSLGVLYAYYAAHFKLMGQEEAAQKCYAAARAMGASSASSPEMSEVKALMDAETPKRVPSSAGAKGEGDRKF